MIYRVSGNKRPDFKHVPKLPVPGFKIKLVMGLTDLPAELRDAVMSFLTAKEAGLAAPVSKWHAEYATSREIRVESLHDQCRAIEQDLVTLCISVFERRYDFFLSPTRLVETSFGREIRVPHKEFNTRSFLELFGPDATHSPDLSPPIETDWSRMYNVVTWLRQMTDIPWLLNTEQYDQLRERRQTAHDTLHLLVDARQRLQHHIDDEITCTYIRERWTGYEAEKTTWSRIHETRHCGWLQTSLSRIHETRQQGGRSWGERDRDDDHETYFYGPYEANWRL